MSNSRINPHKIIQPDRQLLRNWIATLRHNKCQLCGSPLQHGGPTYDVHHVDGNTHNNEPSNLLLHCTNCHPPPCHFATPIHRLTRLKFQPPHNYQLPLPNV